MVLLASGKRNYIEVRPNVEAHPVFGEALAEAKAAGVKVLFLLCRVGRDSLDIVDQREG